MSRPRGILFIGNSYTFCNDLPGQLAGLAASARVERPIETALEASGGWTLEQHWHHARTRETLARGGWDEVVLQEQTRRPYEDAAAYQRFAREFDGAIRALGARTVLYLTWAPEAEPQHQRQLDASIGALGRELGALVVPSGPAFALVHARAPRIDLYVDDRRHPSPAGTYLSACAFFAALHRKSPVGLAPVALEGDAGGASMKPLPADDARVLQTAAWDAVEGWSRPAARA